MSVSSLLVGQPLNAWSQLQVTSIDAKTLTVEGPVTVTGSIAVTGNLSVTGDVQGSSIVPSVRGGFIDRWNVANITSSAGGSYAPLASALLSSFSFSDASVVAATTFVVPSVANVVAALTALGAPLGGGGDCFQFTVVNQSPNVGGVITIDPSGDPAYEARFSSGNPTYVLGPNSAVTVRIFIKSGSATAFIFATST